MLKIGKNWGKIANYPPNAQQWFAPLVTGKRSLTNLPLMLQVSACPRLSVLQLYNSQGFPHLDFVSFSDRHTVTMMSLRLHE